MRMELVFGCAVMGLALLGMAHTPAAAAERYSGPDAANGGIADDAEGEDAANGGVRGAPATGANGGVQRRAGAGLGKAVRASGRLTPPDGVLYGPQ